MGLVDDLKELSALHADGTLTDEEYKDAKAAVIASSKAGTASSAASDKRAVQTKKPALAPAAAAAPAPAPAPAQAKAQAQAQAQAPAAPSRTAEPPPEPKSAPKRMTKAQKAAAKRASRAAAKGKSGTGDGAVSGTRIIALGFIGIVIAAVAYSAHLFMLDKMQVSVRPNGGVDPERQARALTTTLYHGTPAAEQITQLQQLCTGWFKNRGYDEPVPGEFYTKEGQLVTDPLGAGADVLYHVGPGQRFVYPGHDHDTISVEAGNKTYTLKRLASAPIIFKIENFVEDWECDSMKRIGTASGRLKPQDFSSSAHSSADVARVRTSEVGFVGSWLGARTDPALMAAPHKSSPDWAKAEKPFRWFHRIEERAAELVSLSNDEQEPVQIVKYGAGQKYSYHTDFPNPPAFSPGINRLATLLVFLSDVDGGGETHFPLADNPGKTEVDFSSTSESCDLSEGLAVAPKKGDAILWYNMKPASQGVDLKHKEKRAWHAGCPVRGGMKFAANFWFQNGHPVGSCDLVQPEEGTWVFPIECDERNQWQAEWEGKMARGDLDNAVSQVK